MSNLQAIDEREAKPDAGRPLRIVMVAARCFPLSGGIETHVHEVGTRLAAQGHDVTILTADPSGALAPRDTVAGMNVIRVASRPRGKDWCFAPGIYRHLASGESGPDVVHVQGYHTFSAPLAMLGAVRARTPFVLTFHSGGHSSALRRAVRAPQSAALAPLARRAARLIGVSMFEADHFSRAMKIPRDRFTVVPNGAGLPSVEPLITGAGAPLVISLGRLERYKGHHRAIRAFASLRKTLPGAQLRILGTGPYESELARMVDELGLRACVEIGGIPAANRAEMASMIASAALVVLLSDYEAHPIAVVEALSLGRRVVTSDTSGFRELAASGLVRSVPLNAEPEAVAAAMAAEIEKGGSSTGLVDLPGWDECADRLVSIYRSAARVEA